MLRRMENNDKAKGFTWWVWVLLAVPYVGLCFPTLYARATPTLLGFPLFYWYQLVWVVITSALLGVVYKQVKR